MTEPPPVLVSVSAMAKGGIVSEPPAQVRARIELGKGLCRGRPLL